MASKKGLKDSKLEQKSIELPQVGVELHYLTKGPTNAARTLLFCHGLSDKAVNMAPFITSLNIPDDFRVIVTDCIGHGQDLQRVRQEYPDFQQPSPKQQVQAIAELLEMLGVKNCDAFGYSLGGALVYFLRQARPDLVNRTVLLSPAIEACLDPIFFEQYKSGENRFIRIESREDIKQLFRSMSTSKPKKKDPIPKFFYESMYRQAKRDVPQGHWEEMLNVLLDDKDEIMTCSRDVDKDSERLVIWPDKDSICNLELGKKFFSESSNTIFLSIPDCGHVFMSDGTFLMSHVASQVSEYMLQNVEEAPAASKE